MRIEELYIKRIKGQPPAAVDGIVLVGSCGVEGDIFANGSDRQVSILFEDTVKQVRAIAADEACLKKFSCNIVLSGCIPALKAGGRIGIGNAELEITSVGKECYDLCSLTSCPLAESAVFAKVITGGTIKIGDKVIL